MDYRLPLVAVQPIVFVTFLGFGELAWTLDLDGVDDEVANCYRQNAPSTSLQQHSSVLVHDEDGAISESGAEILWKKFDDGKNRAIFRITAPPQRAGTAVLAIESDKPKAPPITYAYLPELRNTRRISGRAVTDSMLETDLSYEDFTYFLSIADGIDVNRAADEQLEGRSSFVLELKPSDPDSEYRFVKVVVDQAECVVSSISFYTDSETEPTKELRADLSKIDSVGTRRIVHAYTMFDHSKNRRTTLEFSSVQIDEDISDGVFSPAGLRSGR